MKNYVIIKDIYFSSINEDEAFVYVDFDRETNMLEKKQKDKLKCLPNLEKRVTEICVENHRTSEPFIKVFQYNEENVTKNSLGSLVGVFEVSDKSEDSTYIVNFIASVAKKEYFSNGRRGSIESLEASLHKINIALAELVKNGTVAWLGKFHGAIGILEKNNFHFSVTGDAKILLIRENTLSEISDGIASSESKTHPIKTFVEISSGRLLTHDKIILTSPELSSLLSNEDIEKNAKRMDDEHFSRFIRTVLINQVNIGGSIIVDIDEPMIVPKKNPKRTRKEQPDITNVFSQNTFVKENNPQDNPSEIIHNNSSTKEDAKEEKYRNRDTGDIFIQGDSFPETTMPIIKEVSYILHTFTMTILHNVSRNNRKLLLFIRVMTDKISLASTKMFVSLQKKIQRNLKKYSQSFHSSLQKNEREKRESASFKTSKKIDTISHFSKKISSQLISLLIQTKKNFSTFLRKCALRYEKKTLIIGVCILFFLIFSSVYFILHTTNTQTVTTEEPTTLPTPLFPIQTEKNAHIFPSSSTIVTTLSDSILTMVSMNDEIYLITATSIINVNNQKQFPLPSNNGTIQFASVMDDLQTIFLYTSEKTLISFTPTNSKFASNILNISPQANVKDIGTYLTYLYILDETSHQLYRFPRANGGFGTATPWIKESFSVSQTPHIAISDTIFISQENNVSLFFRGHFVKNCELGELPLSITSLFTKPDFHFVYALDTENKRILIWDQSGSLIAQYFSEEFASAKEIVVNEAQKTLFATTDTSLLSFPLP